MTRLALVIVASLAVSSPVVSQATCPCAFVSEDADTVLNNATLPGGGSGYKRVVYSVILPTDDFIPGEVLHVVAECEATNDVLPDDEVQMTTQLVLGQFAAADEGVAISEAAAFKITPDMHHGVATRIGTIVRPTSEDKVVKLVAWSSQELALEPGFGKLSVIRIQPDAALATPPTECPCTSYQRVVSSSTPIADDLPSGNGQEVIYSVGPLNDLQIGETLVAFGNFQANNTSDSLTRVSSEIVLGDMANSTGGSSFTKHAAVELTASMAKTVVNKGGSLTINSTNDGDKYVNFVGWSNNGVDSIQSGAGSLTVLRISRGGPSFEPSFCDCLSIREAHSDIEVNTVVPGTDPETFTRLYSVPLLDLQEGEVLMVFGLAEATNAEHTRITSQLFLCENKTDVDGEEITANNAFNLSFDTLADQTKAVISKMGTITVPASLTGDRYVNFVGWSKDGYSITVGRGRLSVVRITPRSP